jgi:acyl dehydratase
MLLLGYISEMMTLAFGAAWASSGKLQVRFRRPARPGDTVAVDGTVTSVTDDGGPRRIGCAVQCRLQDGTVVASGRASLLAFA